MAEFIEELIVLIVSLSIICLFVVKWWKDHKRTGKQPVLYGKKTKKILKIALIVFVVLTALSFWAEKAYYFLLNDQEFTNGPCYTNNGIATIEIRGEIIPYFIYTTASDESVGSTADDAVSSEEVMACINDIQKDDSIRGVIVEINSRGGSPVASEEIMNTLKKLNKPIAAVVRESAISGAYLITTAADRIFASEISDIGGIGVTMSYLDYSQKNKEEGLIYQQLSSGEFKDTGNPDRPLTAEEKELLMRDVNLMHEAFIKDVAMNRRLDIEQVRKLADGSSMLGLAAKENGLIDEIGDANSAEDWLNEDSF